MLQQTPGLPSCRVLGVTDLRAGGLHIEHFSGKEIVSLAVCRKKVNSSIKNTTIEGPFCPLAETAKSLRHKPRTLSLSPSPHNALECEENFCATMERYKILI